MRTLFFILLAGNVLLAAWLVLDRPDPAVPRVPPVPSDVPRLELLSERDAVEELAQPTQQPSAASTGNADQPRVCFTLGPFETEADARAVAGGLDDRVASREIRRSQAESEIGHWVYLPAMPTREDALDAARRLADAGLRDYYVVTAGDQENTVSLGLYRERDNAEGRVETLREMGFEAQMRPRTESVPRYWVDVTTRQDGDRDWTDALEGHPEASVSETDCPAEEG